MSEQASPDFRDARRTLPRWWPRRLSPKAAAAAVAGLFLVGIATWPVAGGFIDWGMDGDLTPGLWEPGQWLRGALLSVIVLGGFGWPVVVLLAVVIAVGTVVLRGRDFDRCATCGSRIDPVAGRCNSCGPLHPRRPRSGGWAWLNRALFISGAIIAIATHSLLVGCGCAWVQLELEEDAFGRRAEAAAAAGATYHEERNRHGSLLMWSAERGYWSHRD